MLRAMKKSIFTLLIFMISVLSYGQCGANVPNYVINLSGAPDSTWVLNEIDALDRDGQCCGANTNVNCISFDITLDSNSAGIFFDYDGAPANGSLGWQIDCGPMNNMQDTICVTDPGPFTLTFCKPGTDNGNYTLISVSKPTFPEDQFVPLNCIQPVEALGVTSGSITWTSISPGNPGDYDYLLDCTDCLTPTFSPDPNAPTYIEYQVCGYPTLDYCVGQFNFCDTVSFTVQDSLLVTATPQNATFCSGGNTIITASATGGDGNYTYFWYDNSLNLVGTGSTFTTGISGTYTVEVRDGNYEVGSCDGFYDSFNVSEVSPPAVNAGNDLILCATSPGGDLNGIIDNATGGIWSGGTGTYISSNTDLNMTYIPTQSEIAFGSVTLTLTSTGAGGGCINNSDLVTLFFVDTIQTDLADISLNCNNSETLISPIITGGLAPLSYSWSNGSTETTTTFGEGTHCLTITDANGCSNTDCFTITVPSNLNLLMSSASATTNGGSDGSATATPTGGTSPYTYLWNNAGTNQTESGLSYGIYTVTVTDDNGCQLNGSVVVNEPACNNYSVTTSSTDVLCFGDSSGTATVTTVNGTSPFTISWNDYNSQSTLTATNLPANVYNVTVIDDNGCIAFGTIPVVEPSALSNSFTQSNVTTQGGSDGSAQANVIGGLGTYNYLWSTADVSSNISNVGTGWYNVSITDDNSCELVDSLFISEPPCNLFDINVGTTPVNCNGDSNGEALLMITNGVGPYNINWSTLETNVNNISGLAAGVYTVEVTDAQNCYAFTSFGVAEPSPLTIGLLTTPSTCNGADNATIDMTVSGGSFPFYSYLWENNSTTEDRVNLAPNNYSVVVTDENGCIANASTTVTQPDAMQIAYTSQNVTCFEGIDGSIDLSILGGTAPFNYNWSNGETTQDLSGLDVGGYILNVTDANFCVPEESTTILILEPSKVIADSIIINCPTPGVTNAQVEVFPNGGTSNYAVSFDNGVSFLTYGDYVENQTVNSAYDIVIKDVNNCLSDVYSINVDDNVIASSINFNKCYFVGQATEVVTITPAGGTADYSISSDNGVTFNPVLDYAITLGVNNSYNVVVKDNKGCASISYPIELPNVIDLSIAVTSDFNGEDISCFGFSDGEATATMSGGTTPYTYLWNNLETTPSINGLTAINYSLTVTDNNNCQISDNITLVNPPVLTSTISVSSNYNGEDVSCYAFNDGEATIIGVGGVGPYTYEWSNSQTASVATGLAATNYTVTVWDANLCETQNSVTLTQPDTLDVQSTIVDVSCNGGNDGEIDITASGGVMPYNYQWNFGPTTEDVTGLSAGTYQVNLTDANNCIYILDELVVDPTAIDLDLVMTNALCKNDTNGLANLNVTGGTPPYTYLWNTGENTEDNINLGAGSYTVTVTDDNGCWTDISGVVTEPDMLAVTETISTVQCYGNNDGIIEVTVVGGTLPYTYLWSNSENTDSISGLIANTYSVSITDNNNCQLDSSYEVTQPDSLWATVESPINFHDHNVSFFGGNDGEIDLTVFGGTADYTFVWSDGETTEDISGLTAGEYNVIITDNQGCNYSTQIELTEPINVEIPTAMSPNGDGKNDTYYINGLEAYPNNKLIVTNRWGNVVYEEEDYKNDWEGTHTNGKELPDGVYYVIIEINDGEITLNSFVELRRK